MVPSGWGPPALSPRAAISNIVAMTNTDRNGLDILSFEECLALLATVPVGRIATSMRALPAVVPVNFVVDRDTVVFRTGDGKKLAAALNHNVVAFQADAWDPATRSGWSVMVVGTAMPIDDPEELAWARSLPLDPWLGTALENYVKIPMVHVSGRRLGATSAPVLATEASASV